MDTPTEDEEFTELADATIPRVDLVGKGANGIPFLIAKSAAGLVPADEIRALIGDEPVEKAAPAGPRETVTVSGSPAAIAAMIHQAPIRKADPAATGQPTHTEEADVAKETEQVTKADDAADAAVEVADIVPETPGGSTAESVPGSPDWEQLDADTAAATIGVLGRVKAALEWLATREATEGVAEGDSGDYDNAFDLEDAACQIDCIIRRLGGYAAGEELETVVPAEVEAVTKAAADAAGPLGVIEASAAIAKAGRVLSSANEQRIKSASDALTEVLATLPAPVDDGQPVAKSQTKEADVAKAAGTITVMVKPVLDQDAAVQVADQMAQVAKAGQTGTGGLEVIKDAARAAAEVGESAQHATEQLAETIEKAKGDPQVAVYTADGTLVGVVDQADISPIAAPSAPAGGDEQSADAPADTEPAAAPAAVAAPEDAATIPGTQTVAAPPPAADDQDDDTVQKSASHAELAELLKETLTPLTEKLGQYAELGDVVKGLQEQVEHLAAMPDDRKSPIMNGATGVPGLATRDGSDVDQLADLRKAVEQADTPEKQLEARNVLAYAAIRDLYSH